MIGNAHTTTLDSVVVTVNFISLGQRRMSPQHLLYGIDIVSLDLDIGAMWEICRIEDDPLEEDVSDKLGSR